VRAADRALEHDGVGGKLTRAFDVEVRYGDHQLHVELESSSHAAAVLE
jgi:hypothetical protein